MSLYIASLNSGSNGNCYYVGNHTDAVLIDAGISCRETERRMARLGLSMQSVRAIFVSHEHTDHIGGIPVLAKKHNLPVYISALTLQHSGLNLQNAVGFAGHDVIEIAGLRIATFSKLHDAAEPFSFTVSYNDITVGVFTDIGEVCENLEHHFSRCHAAFLEANYDTELLENGSYPYHLKNRIRGGKGHLSNKQALDIFVKARPAFMSHLLLAHLSRDNNRPELVQELFERHAQNVEIIVASRYQESAVYQIGGHKPLVKPATKIKAPRPVAVQYTLF